MKSAGTNTRHPTSDVRSFLLLTRDSVIDALGEIIVAPLTTRIRAIPTEVVLTPDDDGMPAACAINLDHVSLARRPRIGALIDTLRDARWPDVERALLIACGFRVE